MRGAWRGAQGILPASFVALKIVLDAWNPVGNRRFLPLLHLCSFSLAALGPATRAWCGGAPFGDTAVEKVRPMAPDGVCGCVSPQSPSSVRLGAIIASLSWVWCV
jgi:hypothetical protein